MILSLALSSCMLSVCGFKKPHRVLYLTLRRALPGVGVEVFYRIVGDGPKVLARDINLPQPYRYPHMGVKGLQRVGPGKGGVSSIHAVAPDAERLGDLTGGLRIDHVGKPDPRGMDHRGGLALP